MYKEKLIIILVITLIIIYYLNNTISSKLNIIDNFDLINKDHLMIVVTDDEFYYLNIKNNETNRFDVYRIPLYLIKSFYN